MTPSAWTPPCGWVERSPAFDRFARTRVSFAAMPARARLGLLSLLVLVAAACGTSAAPTQAVITGPLTPTATALRTAGQATVTPAGATVTPATTATRTPGATVTPAASSDADTCGGSASNKDFFATAAQAFKWAIYCAILPAGWYGTGTWAGDPGGELTITYKGPGGVSLELKEGAYCTDDQSICQPKVKELGPTLYGDLTGTLYTLEPGYAVYVNAGTSPPSWAAATVTLDETTFVKLVASLHKVVP